jgi:hypothetical protein
MLSDKTSYLFALQVSMGILSAGGVASLSPSKYSADP